MSDEARRLLTFDVDGSVYALPIGGVLEVAESGEVTPVPTLARTRCGVMNWHGDALPVVAPTILLEAGEGGGEDAAPAPDAEAEAEVVAASDAADRAEARDALRRVQVLVVTDRSQSPKLGLPIDGVLGLVDAGDAGARVAGVLVERRSIDGRVVSIVDPQGLVRRAERVIDAMVA